MSDTENTTPPVEPTPVNDAPTNPTYPAYTAAPPAQTPTNPLSIISLIASIASFVFLPLIGAVVGIVTGHIALGQIKRTGEQGRPLAIWGTILGYIHIALAVIGIAIFIIVLVVVGVSTKHGIDNSVNSYSQCLNQHPNSSSWALHCDTQFNKDFGNATN